VERGMGKFKALKRVGLLIWGIENVGKEEKMRANKVRNVQMGRTNKIQIMFFTLEFSFISFLANKWNKSDARPSLTEF
jgi:hypothetical protein